ncbi:MAG: hypothetical protein ACRD0U_13025 [Acidimicrobiales bacterium]
MEARLYFNGISDLTADIASGRPLSSELSEDEIEVAQEAYSEAIAFNAELPVSERIIEGDPGQIPLLNDLSDRQLAHLADLARGDCSPAGCDAFATEVARTVPD